MISIDEIEKTIIDLESKETSYAVCEKLSYLYIVRDHIKPSSTAEFRSDSEFMKSLSGKSSASVWKVLDELMTTIKVIQPRLYEATISEIKKI